jgi:hypothetical protein
MSRTKSIIFTPAPERIGTPAIALHQEPEEDIVLLGLMLDDVRIAGEMLRALAYSSSDGYCGNLRVVSGAADRLRKRAARLLKEAAE